MLKAIEILKDIQGSKLCGVKPTLVKWNLEDFNNAIKELEQCQKDLQTLKILFDSGFCRCSNCGQYKRSGFNRCCEND